MVAVVTQHQRPHSTAEGYALFTLRDTDNHRDVQLGLAASQDIECQILCRLEQVDNFKTTTYSKTAWPIRPLNLKECFP